MKKYILSLLALALMSTAVHAAPTVTTVPGVIAVFTEAAKELQANSANVATIQASLTTAQGQVTALTNTNTTLTTANTTLTAANGTLTTNNTTLTNQVNSMISAASSVNAILANPITGQ